MKDEVCQNCIWWLGDSSGDKGQCTNAEGDTKLYVGRYESCDSYLANDIGLKDQSVFSLPIHQKATNFQLRIFNDSPFPVSLNAMMWEGNYSPRFYRRT